MPSKVLIAYASKRGSTREVAEMIAATLHERGLRIDLLPAGDVDDLAPYAGVVLGGAIYMGRWHKDARHFLKRHRRALAQLPVAVFAMGPIRAETKLLAQSRLQLDAALAKTPEIDPVLVGVFGGVLDPRKVPFPFKLMDATDARDWTAVCAWAGEAAERLALSVANTDATGSSVLDHLSMRETG